MYPITQKIVFEVAKQESKKEIDYLKNSIWRQYIFGAQWYEKNTRLIKSVSDALDAAIVAIEKLEQDFNDKIALDILAVQLETISKIHLTPTIQTNGRWKKVRVWLEKDHAVRKKAIELSVGVTLLIIAMLGISFANGLLVFGVAALLAVPFFAKEIKKTKTRTKKHLKKATEDIQRAGTQIQFAVNERKLCVQKQHLETREQVLEQNMVALKQEVLNLRSDQHLLKQKAAAYLEESKILNSERKKQSK